MSSSSLGLLDVSARIKSFHFDERKFLNGLTEEEFWRITKNIETKDDFKDAPRQYKTIIDDLVKQEENKDKNPSYLGAKENVTFLVTAAFIQYEPALRAATGKYHAVPLPWGNNSTIETPFLGIDLGNREYSYSRDGKETTRLIRPESLLDSHFHQALFRGLDHSTPLRPGFTSIAYEVAVLEDKVNHDARYNVKESFSLRWGKGRKKQQANFQLGMLTFSVEVQLQYKFTPAKGRLTKLEEKFGLRNYTVHERGESLYA